MKDVVIIFLTLIIGMILLVIFIGFKNDCEQKGGAYVASAIGYTCVERLKP